MLQILNLTIKFNIPAFKREAVSLKKLTIRKGEVLALLGESGSGKSLLSLAIMDLLPENAQLGVDTQILLDKNEISHLPEVAMRKIRGKAISMIFQEPMTALNPVMTVGEQVAEMMINHRICPKRAVQAKVIELFEQVELREPKKLYAKYPHELSGGMKQRIMIAMALAAEPELLIADEPTSALDVSVQFEILQLLKKLQKEKGLSILLITHDISVVREIADSIAIMYAGKILEFSQANVFFKAPLHPYSQGLMNSLPNYSQRGSSLATIEGVVPPLTEKLKGCVYYNRCPLHKPQCLIAHPSFSTYHSSEVACVLYESSNKTESITIPQPPISKTKKNIEHEQTILELDSVKVHFPVKKGVLKRTVDYVKAVDGVSFQVTAGKTIAIVGESGSGKTTLAKAILGLTPHTGGEINFKLIDVAKRNDFRKALQIIFQDPFSSLNPRMLVGDIIAEGFRALKLGNTKEQLEKVKELIRHMGLPEDSIHRYPHEFSGGQRQRICIARALAVEPKIIVCDEPTSALDLSIQAQIINLLKRLQQERSLTYLFITHNMALVSYFADEIIVMKNGKVVEQGSAEAIINSPEKDYTKTLIEAAKVGGFPAG